ncbi:MAG: hypothetical protein AB7O52_03440 [Planctomycetota bacterium]
MKLKLLIALAALAAVPVYAQSRKSQPKAQDFPTLHASALKHFEEKKFGDCIQTLNELIRLAQGGLWDTVVAAHPAPVEGFEYQEPKRNEVNAAFLQGLAGMQQPIEWDYRKSGGSISVSVHPNSPAAPILEATMKMAAMQENVEEIGYEKHKGLLEKQESGRLELKILIWGKHLITVTAQGLTEDGLFAMFNQAFVNSLASILGAPSE